MPPLLFHRVLACALTLGPAIPAHAALVNRWSFDQTPAAASAGTTFIDDIGGLPAIVRGVGATLDGSSLVLPGTTTGNQSANTISAYLDLPNGLISSKTHLSVELWATPAANRAWQRLIDFGRTVQAGDGLGAPGEYTGTPGSAAPGTTQASDNLVLSLQVNANLSAQRLEARLDSGTAIATDTALATTAGTQYHYVLVFEDGAGTHGLGGGQVRWYRNGSLAATTDVPFRLADLEDVNNWLGRSQWSGDNISALSCNELRLYDHALSATEIAASLAAGPNSRHLLHRWTFNLPAGPVAAGTTVPDSVSGADGLLIGLGATSDGTALTLPGNGTGDATQAAISAYVDLPNALISPLTDVTVEFWLSPLGSRTWQRAFDFGRMTGAGDGLGAPGEWTASAAGAPTGAEASDSFMLSLNRANNLSQQRAALRLNRELVSGQQVFVEPDLATTAGTRYHHAVTFRSGTGAYAATGGGQLSFYRDGVLAGTADVPFGLASIEDVNNWLGRSQFATDGMANFAIHELRLYARALNASDLAASLAAGPDANIVIPPPVANDDTVSLHPGQKVRVHVTANDTGLFLPGGIAIATPPSAGTATITGDGRILYSNTNAAAPSDAFTYTVAGAGGTSAPATVSIQLSPTLRLPLPAGVNIPSAPPATGYGLVNALGTLTFNQPLALSSPPGDTNRLFICERMARIRVVPDVTAASPTASTFLDLTALVATRTGETIEGGANGEHGLLGLAFHPDYATNGHFYVAYTVRLNAGSYYQRISRFTVSAADPLVANPASELVLLQQLDEEANHNGGDLHFGPDGYLYYAVGDEGSQRDGRQNSQRIDKDFFAGIFRFDVDKLPGSLAPTPHASIPTDAGVARFAIPPDNPFVGATTFNGVAINTAALRAEYWALGLRHVWRMAFDSVTGELWAGDVGQDRWEEVNVITKGGNYGWVYREGAENTAFTSPAPPTKPAGFTSLDPLFAYGHTGVATDTLFSGASIVGGQVYRGTRFPSLAGAYVFSDTISGHIWTLRRDPEGGPPTVERIAGESYTVSTGVDPANGDILFCDYDSGRILRLIVTTQDTTFPTTLTATGVFADLADLSPQPGLLPYAPNLSFWSDHAVKQRWFALPDAAATFTYQTETPWGLPAGSFWVKHFDLELTRGDPATKRRIETRLLVRTDSGAYGVSYRWNEAQTEATLVDDAGEDFDIAINDAGLPHTQRWHIPSRAECLACHTSGGGHALSFNTRQLNRSGQIHGHSGNQLTLLREAGYLPDAPTNPAATPRHVRPDENAFSLETRARSLLAVNCAYCHQEGGATPPSWDGRASLTLATTGLVNGPATQNGGDSANRLVVPGDIGRSIIHRRMTASGGFTRMPPLATTELDATGNALIAEWIIALAARPDYAAWRLGTFGSADSPEGAETADPDGDGQSNQSEFIAFTDPLDPDSVLRVALDPGAEGTTITVSFVLPPDRLWSVETSTDLVTWSPWAVDGADGLPRNAATLITLAADTPAAEAPRRFFRLRLTMP